MIYALSRKIIVYSHNVDDTIAKNLGDYNGFISDNEMFIIIKIKISEDNMHEAFVLASSGLVGWLSDSVTRQLEAIVDHEKY